MVVGIDRRRVRHHETVRVILRAAWELAERDGVAGLSLGELARMVGMRPQSIYTYFASKHAVYDAMYRQGFEELAGHFARLRPAGDAQRFLARAAESFVDFAIERPSRYQLLFQRTVPGFEPTPESYAVAIDALETMRGWLATTGIRGERNLDLWRTLLLGLAGEQLANDPGGTRWRALAGPAARYFVQFARATRGGR